MLRRKFLTLMLALAMVLAYSVPALNPDVQSYAADSGTATQFINDARWKNGISWGAIRPKLSSWSSTGCCAYAADFAKYCYGADSPSSGTRFGNPSEIRSGDIIEISGHWFCVISRTNNALYTCEGNFSGKVRVASDVYTISGNTLNDKYNGVRQMLNGYHYSGGTPSAPTVASVSIPKTSYAVDEKVTFNINANGTTTNLWIYCPNGQTLTYNDVGSSYSVVFGMSGYYEGLVETWNGVGSKKSSRISWRVGKPTICNLSIAKDKYAVDEKVTFNMEVDGTATNLWIYCPDGQTLTYKDVGATYTIGFGMSGHYEALAETWNGIGSKQSARVSWDVGTTDTRAPKIKNAKIADDSGDNIVIEANVTDDKPLDLDGNWITTNDGSKVNCVGLKTYFKVGSEYKMLDLYLLYDAPIEWVSNSKVRITFKKKWLSFENIKFVISAKDKANNKSTAQILYKHSDAKNLKLKISQTIHATKVWPDFSTTNVKDQSYYGDVLEYDKSTNTFIAKKAGRATLFFYNSIVGKLWGAEVTVSCNTHSWGAGKVTKAATCTKDGNRVYVCECCGETRTESIPKTGHSYVHKKIAAKVGVAGSEYDECSVCGNKNNVKTIAALKPIATKISSLKAAKKAFTVKWKKCSGITGYQIQYGLKSNFKGSKTVTVSKNSTVSKKVKKLKAKKKYYVRVRTYTVVNGTKYYSSWSPKKAIKTK